MDYWGTPEINRKMMAALGCATFRDMMKQLHIDNPANATPKYVGPPIPPHMDEFGVRYADIDFGAGVYAEPVSCPLARFDTVEEIERIYLARPDW
jgi:hypothetical protein